MKLLYVLFYLPVMFFFAASPTFAENSGDSLAANTLSFAQGELLFKPLLANTYEPRAGILAQVGKNRLRLDIGNSIDLLAYQFPRDSAVATLGSDFFTYTLLRGERNFHFPVDASDYFFGINFNFKKYLSDGLLTARLRVSHVSSHFVDGHYDNTQAAWKDARPPVVYSREFLDGVAAFQPDRWENRVRVYAGATYLFHVDPKSLPRLLGDAGIEAHTAIAANLSAYIAYEATLLRITETSIRHNIQIGMKIGSWEGRGLNLCGSYFSGYSIHGEYFNVKETYFAVGFLVDL